MYRIAKRFDFDAAHQLTGLPDGHKCRRLHGHTYVVEVEVSGDLDSRGMVADYAELEPFGRWLKETLDHRNLNDLMVEPTTTEHVARRCYDAVRATCAYLNVTAVRVWESSTTWAEYRP